MRDRLRRAESEPELPGAFEFRGVQEACLWLSLNRSRLTSSINSRRFDGIHSGSAHKHLPASSQPLGHLSRQDAFRRPPIAKPCLDEAEADAAREAVLSGWISQGPQVAAFEREFAALAVGALHAVAVSNCTTALHLALLALGVGPGERCDHRKSTFFHRKRQQHPLLRRDAGFVDIDPATYNLDPERVAEAINDTYASDPGRPPDGAMPCDLALVCRFGKSPRHCPDRGPSRAIGSQINIHGDWDWIGKPHGSISCFSFHPRKVITTGEGGMLTTSDSDHDRKLRLWRQHGMDVPDTVRHGSPQVIFENYLSSASTTG